MSTLSHCRSLNTESVRLLLSQSRSLPPTAEREAVLQVTHTGWFSPDIPVTWCGYVGPLFFSPPLFLPEQVKDLPDRARVKWSLVWLVLNFNMTCQHASFSSPPPSPFLSFSPLSEPHTGLTHHGVSEYHDSQKVENFFNNHLGKSEFGCQKWAFSFLEDYCTISNAVRIDVDAGVLLFTCYWLLSHNSILTVLYNSNVIFSYLCLIVQFHLRTTFSAAREMSTKMHWIIFMPTVPSATPPENLKMASHLSTPPA